MDSVLEEKGEPMTCVNLELLLYEIQKLEGPIDKDLILQIIRNCLMDPYEDLLIKIYKESR